MSEEQTVGDLYRRGNNLSTEDRSDEAAATIQQTQAIYLVGAAILEQLIKLTRATRK